MVGKLRVVQQLLIGSHCGIDAVDTHADGLFPTDHPHVLRCVVFFRRLPCFLVDDTRFVEFVQFLHDGGVEAAGQSVGVILHVGQQSSRLQFFHIIVMRIVGLEVLHERVLLGFHGLVAFVDGELKLGDERGIGPWLSGVVVEMLLGCARQEPDDDGNSAHDEQGACCEVAQPVFF